jgi:predicted RNase H-like nuclease (RuvC/YqgF family)
MRKIEEQMEEQIEMLYKILQKVQAQETIPEGTKQQKTLNNIEEQMEEQIEMLYKILQKMQAQETIPEGTKQHKTLNNILKQIQKQETMLEETKQQVEQQQEMLNIIFRQVTGNYLPVPPVQFKSPFSIIDKFDFDTEKLIKIAMFLSDLYRNENKVEAEE